VSAPDSQARNRLGNLNNAAAVGSVPPFAHHAGNRLGPDIAAIRAVEGVFSAALDAFGD
jgi:hypothetical protein